MDEVRTMADVRVRAEASAWVTRDAYRDDARNRPGISRSDRASMLRKARDYKRRAIRVSQYLNRIT